MLPVLYRQTMNWPQRSLANDWFDREFGRIARSVFGNGSSYDSEAMAVYPMNVWEDDDAIHVEAEIPGFKRDEIDITIEQGTLQISAERKQEKSQPTNSSPILTERTWSRYFRSLALPAAVQEDVVNAKYEDGVLHLTMPKRPEVKPRRIKVQ
jgi:HSP20 family protein